MQSDANQETLLGLHALMDDFDLELPRPRVRSCLVRGNRRTWVTEAGVLEQYPRGYKPEAGRVGQLRFALKYEPIDLGAYKAIFAKMDRTELERWIQSEPHSIFARRAWYLFEMFTGTQLEVADLKSGPYIDLLNPEIHIVGPAIRARRQRVNANLLGSLDYCPLIRRTEKLMEAFNKNLAERARALILAVDPAILKRAVHYLFTKETKASFAIEGEAPSKDRASRFVATLVHAEDFKASIHDSFIELQNAIVEPRYSQKAWREVQVYVGESLSDFSQLVHFVCPKPEDVPSLMNGWMRMLSNLIDSKGQVDPVCVAGAAAFGFVFIHPFDDGNGRIHRFLVHHVLAKLKFSPQGLVFPVSASMLRNMTTYDKALEAFSDRIAPFVHYTMDDDLAMTVANETADLYRYFDATPQTEYLFECIEDAIARDLKMELDFLTSYDAAMRAIQEVVDMPSQRAALLFRLIGQNHGRLSNRKRDQFPELADEEIERIEAGIQAATSLNPRRAIPTENG